MTFKSRPSSYLISLAPTSRAHCRGCKRLVERGELRFAITVFVRPNRSTCLVRCCQCVDAKFAKTVLSVYGTAARVPAETTVPAPDAAMARGKLDAARSGHSTASEIRSRQAPRNKSSKKKGQTILCHFAAAPKSSLSAPV